MTSTRATSASWSVVLLALCIAGTLQPFSAQAQTVPVPPGLVAWWSGEGNANDRLGSSNGTLAPGTSFVAGKVGQAFSLDGSREGVILGNPAALALQDLTFEAWVKRAVPAPGIATLDNPGWGGMLINHGPAGYAFYIMPNGQLGFGQETVTEVLSGPLLAVTDTNWHHVAVTKEGTTLVFYVDGVSKTVLGFTSVFTFGNLAGVGRDGYSELNSFYGSIDEMSVYNRALSAAEIQAIAAAPGGKVLVDPVPAPQAQTVPVPPGLVAWWSGEGNASDRLGASNGTLAPGISFVTGKVGQAFSLDAVSEGVSLGNATQPAALQLQNFTIETWVKRAVSAAAIPPYATLDNPGWGGILIDYGPGGYALELLPNGQLGFGQETVNEVPSGPLLAVTDTNWHHVAVTKAGTTLVFYVDGVSNTVLGYSNVFTFGNSAAVGMGGGPARKAQSFYGSIDEMSVYNRALTAAEIQAIAVAPGGKAFSYMVTATAGTNGSISPSGAVSVNQGASQTFSITPSTGYHIAGVLADGSSVGAVGSYSFSNVTANHTISASFAINTYTLTATAGSNGSITPSGTSTVNYGGNQAFTITPNVGYHVADVVVDGSSAGMVGSYSFANIAADHTISASFAADSYAITASAGANGSISPSGTTAVNYGSSQAFTITPSTGYHIADVLVDGASVGAVGSYTINTVTTDHTVTASFAINTYTLTASAGANGSISPAGATTVNYGVSQAFIITPNTGYHIADVLVDGNSVGAVGSYTFDNVIADHAISASFAINTYTITSSAGAGGSISPAGATMVNYGTDQQIAIAPNTGYHIADVLVDGASVGAVGSYTINTVTTDHTVIASFAINTYTLTATAGVGGTIAPPGVTTVIYGSSQTFTIVASAGYGIAEVAVDGTSVGAVSSYSFTSVTTEHTISASFADITPPVITLNGPNPLLLELGTPFVDPGATASDLVDGDLTASIQTSDNVDPSTEGTYTRTYTVRDQAGNSASATRTVQVVVTPNSYGLIATHSLHLRQSARLLSGFVGVVNQGQKPFLAGKVELVVGTKVQTAQSVRLSAPRVQVRQSTTIAGELVYTQLLSVGKKATIAQKTQVPASYFPLFQGFGLPAFQTGTPGSRDVEVKQKASATLSAGSYGEVQVKQKGTLTFSGGTYSLRSLEAGPNSKVLFLAPTILLIREQLSLDQNSTFGPATGSGISAADILVYVEGRNGRPSSDDGDNEGDDEEDDEEGRNLRKSPKVAKVGVNASFQGNLYVPNGTIHLRQGSACVGAFIGRDIIVGVRAQVAVQSGWNTPGVVYQPAPIVSLGKLADAQGAEAALPQGAGLLANYPNPFNPSTTIPYVLTEIAPVKLSVYNVLGQQIRVLVDQLQVPGAYEVSWDGMDAAGVQVAGGVYFCRLEAGEHQVVSRMLLLK